LILASDIVFLVQETPNEYYIFDSDTRGNIRHNHDSAAASLIFRKKHSGQSWLKPVLHTTFIKTIERHGQGVL